MKKTFFILALGFLAFGQLLAKKMDGYFITNSHDTVEVVFNVPVKLFSQQPNYESLQYKVKFLDKSGKKFTLRPDEALEISFMFENQQVRMLSRGNNLGSNNIFNINSKIFLRLEIEGPVNMFHYYYTQSTPGMFAGPGGGMTGGHYYNVEQYILQKGDEPLKRPRTWSFKKDMAEYFQDCSVLVERIESKEFRKNEVESIVVFYNSQCQ